jgi:hypothetical protein
VTETPEFDTLVNAEGKYRWVYNNPVTGEQRVGPKLHKTKALAIRAGKEWLATRKKK